MGHSAHWRPGRARGGHCPAPGRRSPRADQKMILRAREFRYTVPGRALIMGIVNVTPDSFSDGGRFVESSAAIEQGLKLIAEGADIIDVGGESTRPGAVAVPEDEELRRVIPVIESLARQNDQPISIDTLKP